MESWADYLTQVGMWHARRATAPLGDESDITSDDIATPVACWARMANYYRQTDHLLTGASLMPNGNLLLLFVVRRDDEVKEERQLLTIHPDAARGLVEALAVEGNRRAPNAAESPVVVWTVFQNLDGVVAPARFTIDRAGRETMRVTVRFNYALRSEDVFPRHLLDAVIDALMTVRPRPRVLFYGPSGVGKTTALAAMVWEWLKREPFLSFVYLGRYTDPILFAEPTLVWGWREEILVPPTVSFASHQQARFAGILSSLEVAATQGATRSKPDAVIQDEVMSASDVMLMALCTTDGSGFLSTTHAPALPPQPGERPPWQARLESFNPPVGPDLITVDVAVMLRDYRVAGVYLGKRLGERWLV